MSNLRSEGVDLADAFPDFDASVYGIEPHRAPKKSRRERKQERRARRKRREKRAGMSQIQRQEDYYNQLINIKPPMTDSSDSDSEDVAPVHPPYFQYPWGPQGRPKEASSDSDSDDYPSHPHPSGPHPHPSGPHPHPSGFHPHPSGLHPHPSTFAPIPPCQAINDKRSRQAGWVPNPDQPEKRREVEQEHGVRLPPYQPPRAWRGPTEIHVNDPGNPGAATLYENPNPPPLSTSVPYSQLNTHQKSRLAVTNQGDTVQHNLASSRQNFMSGAATGGGATSSAAELAFGNLSYADPESGVDNYNKGGGVGARNPMRPTETADPGMALFDFTQDNLYPYWGYTDYAATYTNPYTGEVSHTYTLDMERYKTDIWKEVPTFELGRPHHKMMAWTGNDRTARPMPRKGEEPNEYVMPSADPTFGYAEAVAGRADQEQRVNRETFFTRDPQLAAPRDEGNWTGYVGLRNMARYDNANVRSLKDAPFAGPDRPYQIPQSDFTQRPTTQGMTAPAFYVSGNPDLFVDTVQYADATGSVNPPPIAQEGDRLPAMADIPMMGVIPEVGSGMMQPSGPQAGPRPSYASAHAQVAAMAGNPETGMDMRPPQDATATHGAVNVPMDVIAIPGLPRGIGNVPIQGQAGSGKVTETWSGTGQPRHTSDAYAPGPRPVDPNPSGQTDYLSRPSNPSSSYVAGPQPQAEGGVLRSVQWPNPQVGMQISTGVDGGFQPKGLDRPVADMITVNPVQPPTTEVRGGWQSKAPASFNPATLVGGPVAMPHTQAGGHTMAQAPDRMPVTDSIMVNPGRGAESDVRMGWQAKAPDRQPAAIQSSNVAPLPSAAGMTNPVEPRAALSRDPAMVGQAVNLGHAAHVKDGFEAPRQPSGDVPRPGDYAQPTTNIGHAAHVKAGFEAGWQQSADVPRPGDYAQPDVNLMVRPEAMDTIEHLNVSVPDYQQMNFELKDGSKYLNARQNTDAFLQSSWATDTARARNSEMALPRNQGITMVNPVTEAAQVMRVKGAENFMPPQPSQASMAGSRTHAAAVFKAAAPEPMYASDTDYETDRC